jgi:endonuclease YncB( thermonuclease family)
MIRRMLALLALLAAVSATVAPTSAHADWQADGTVVAILGDDTVAVRFPGTSAATTIRLIGVEVPKHDECGHMMMIRALDAMMLGKVVTVEFDRSGPLHDRQGRTWAYLWLGQTLNEEHTVNEMATAYAYDACHPSGRGI